MENIPDMLYMYADLNTETKDNSREVQK